MAEKHPWLDEPTLQLIEESPELEPAGVFSTTDDTRDIIVEAELREEKLLQRVATAAEGAQAALEQAAGIAVAAARVSVLGPAAAHFWFSDVSVHELEMYAPDGDEPPQWCRIEAERMRKEAEACGDTGSLGGCLEESRAVASGIFESVGQDHPLDGERPLPPISGAEFAARIVEQYRYTIRSVATDEERGDPEKMRHLVESFVDAARMQEQLDAEMSSGMFEGMAPTQRAVIEPAAVARSGSDMLIGITQAQLDEALSSEDLGENDVETVDVVNEVLAAVGESGVRRAARLIFKAERCEAEALATTSWSYRQPMLSLGMTERLLQAVLDAMKVRYGFGVPDTHLDAAKNVLRFALEEPAVWELLQHDMAGMHYED